MKIYLKNRVQGVSWGGGVVQLWTAVLMPYECGHEAMTGVLTFGDFWISVSSWNIFYFFPNLFGYQL